MHYVHITLALAYRSIELPLSNHLPMLLYYYNYKEHGSLSVLALLYIAQTFVIVRDNDLSETILHSSV